MATGTFALPISSGADEFGWVRPNDWLPMPTIGAQEFIGLLAITDDDMNHIALTFGGNYTIDWGDGVTENYNSNVVASHSYTYSSISNATLSTRGYKQVLVRVTPQAGANLTAINLQQQNNIIAKPHCVSWLEMALNGAFFTVLTLGGGSIQNGMCEKVTIGTTGVLTSLLNLFNNFYALQSVPLFDTSSVTTFQSFFINCGRLKSIPLFNTGLGQNFVSSFQYCYSLESIPLINMSSATNVFAMFNNCQSLYTMPLLNTVNVLNFSGFLETCRSLQLVPNLNTANGTNFSGMLSASNSIAKGAFQGTRYSITYAACLSRTEIVNVFNGLGTAAGAQTLTISSNPGWATVTAAEKLIATNKNWTLA